jgi:DNA-binding CsgD family transcriptional regulator
MLGGDDTEDLLREAVELLQPSVARYETAVAELWLARVTSSDVEARTLLRSALDSSLECGSPGLYRRAAAELRQRGVDVPAEPKDVRWVSVAERRIVDLAATGATYRAIAQDLFLTPAAVERTLADVRARLGVPPDATDGVLAAAMPPA